MGNTELATRAEVKNMNSFRSVFRALEYEVERQRRVVEDGGRVVQETRGWVDDRGVTVSQRSKEHAHDYRYFPEPGPAGASAGPYMGGGDSGVAAGTARPASGQVRQPVRPAAIRRRTSHCQPARCGIFRAGRERQGQGDSTEGEAGQQLDAGGGLPPAGRRPGQHTRVPLEARTSRTTLRPGGNRRTQQFLGQNRPAEDLRERQCPEAYR